MVGDSLGVVDAEKELKASEVRTVGQDKYYRLQQLYSGIPVYGKTIVVSADGVGYATALTSNFEIITGNLDLEPTITFDQLKNSIMPYFDTIDLEVANFDNNGLILYVSEPNKFVLAYNLIINGTALIIDAHSAEVLANADQYCSAVTACIYSGGSFGGAKISDEEYLIGNMDRGIFVFNGDYQAALDYSNGSYIVYPDKVKPMNSKDNYFGNDGDSFDSNEYTKAVYLLNQLEKAANYFSKINSDQIISVIAVINNGFDPTNAFGGYGATYGITTYNIPYYNDNIIRVFLGHELCANIQSHLDTIAHEFTHGVNHSQGAFLTEGNEPAALDEAYADIFGELLEANLLEETPNWMHGKRNMRDPHIYENMTYPYPATMSDIEKAKTGKTKDGLTLYFTTSDDSGTDFAHFACIVVSHSAYLMWNGIDGEEDKKIDSELLANLWYRSLLLL